MLGFCRRLGLIRSVGGNAALLSQGNKTQRVAIELREEDIEEKFVRGSGPGGQKINKTASAVWLLHKPTGIHVKCQEQRNLDQNRKIARKWLLAKIDDHYNPETSKLALQRKRAQRRKSKQSKRSKLKYHQQEEDDGSSSQSDEGDSDNEEKK
jgi:protein subunit release factor B